MNDKEYIDLVDVSNMKLRGFVQLILIDPYRIVCHFQEAESPQSGFPMAFIDCDLDYNCWNDGKYMRGMAHNSQIVANFDHMAIVDGYIEEMRTGRIVKFKIPNLVRNKITEYLEKELNM